MAYAMCKHCSCEEGFCAIAAAVAGEREACAKVADSYREQASLTVFTLGTGPERDEWISKGDAAVEIAAAIRSRSSEGGNGLS